MLRRPPFPPPDEKLIILIRRHPAVLFGSILLVLGSFGAALSVTELLKGSGWIRFTWVAFAVVCVRFVWRANYWHDEYFVVTQKRMLRYSGVMRRKVESLPLAKVFDVRLRRSGFGRLIGYGHLVLESIYSNSLIWRFDYCPYPEQLWLELWNSTFPDEVPPRYPRRRVRWSVTIGRSTA